MSEDLKSDERVLIKGHLWSVVMLVGCARAIVVSVV